MPIVVVGGGKHSNLPPVERGYFIGSNAKEEHALSVCMHDRRSLFVVSSVAIVNIERSLVVVNRPCSR